jgi:hypothetical protein
MATLLDPDENDEAVDQIEYMSMIGSHLYLTMTQSDIQFSVCLCTCFHASPRSSHWQAIQQIFKYLKYTLEFRIWYSASSSLDIFGFSNVDFAECGIDRKSTSTTCHFIGSSLVCWSSHKQITIP